MNELDIEPGEQNIDQILKCFKKKMAGNEKYFSSCEYLYLNAQ